MAKFCTNCGRQIDGNTKFCPHCGTAAAPSAPARQDPAQNGTQPARPYAAPTYQTPGYAGNGAERKGIPAPGFSGRVNDPQILAAVKKSRRAAGIFSFFLVPLPLIGFVIYSMVSDQMKTADALQYGAIVSAVFLVFALYSFIKSRAQNTYEATVIDKRSRRAYRHNSADDNSYYTEYITVVRTAAGKKKKIVEREGAQIWAWDYLQVGDRFRYHPQFHFPYELYDKSKAPYIPCISCLARNAVEADRCGKCGLPLLK